MGVGIACPVETGFMGRYEVGIFPSNPSNHYSNITDYITTTKCENVNLKGNTWSRRASREAKLRVAIALWLLINIVFPHTGL